MFVQILLHTPTWVFILLAALIGLGAMQLRTRNVGVRRAWLPAAALAVFSMAGVAGVFGWQPAVWIAWLACAWPVAFWIARMPAPRGTRFDVNARQYTIPGSIVPMLLILTLFCVKYAVGVAMAMDASLAADRSFAVAVAAAYGVFGGIFAGRAWRLLRLSRIGLPAVMAA